MNLHCSIELLHPLCQCLSKCYPLSGWENNNPISRNSNCNTKIWITLWYHENQPNYCKPPKILDHKQWLAYNVGLPNPVDLARNTYWPNYLLKTIQIMVKKSKLFQTESCILVNNLHTTSSDKPLKKRRKQTQLSLLKYKVETKSGR